MEGFLSTFPPYSVCGNPVCVPAAQGGGGGGGRGKREGRFVIPQGLNYLELCRAILAQVGPGSASLRRASTKECGVQVNAKVAKAVQCSLGPKTLFCPEEDRRASAKSPKRPDPCPPEGEAPGGTPPVSALRFLRPVSIYSPVFDRRILLRRPCDGEAERGEPDAEGGGEDTAKDVKATFRQSSKGSNFQVKRASRDKLIPN